MPFGDLGFKFRVVEPVVDGQNRSYILMTNINRRHLARVGLVFPFAMLATALRAQESGKPEVKWSEAKPIIKEYVEKMSAASKQSSGVEFTAEQKAKLVDSIMADMEAQHIYAFIDP
jgi:hypothetical protein